MPHRDRTLLRKLNSRIDNEKKKHPVRLIFLGIGMGENVSVTNLGVFGTVEIQVRVGCPLLVCDGFDVVVDARDEDLAVDGDESGHELNQICHRMTV